MPPKRKREEEETIETGNVDCGDFSDGDESEEEDGDNGTDKMDKYNMMTEDDIEGQEDPTQEFDGEIQITPFNMKEEMEEGHIDKEGMYIFGKRPKDEVKDHWLDNIDWVKVNSQSASLNKNASDEDEDMDAEGPEMKKFDAIAAYKEILTLIVPGETVLKGLKRLGGGKIQTASERWKKKKQTGTEAAQDNAANKESIAKLTELADAILTNSGNMDIYQETYEGIRFKIQQAEAGPSSSKLDADLDMFGEVFDEKDAKKDTAGDGDEPMAKKVRFSSETPQVKEAEDESKSSDNVFWEFKWENEDKAEVHGPHSTTEMQEWVSQGYFEAGVWVRRVGQQGDFYSSRRVDFELYL